MENCHNYLDELELDDDKPFQVVIKPFKKLRTEQQNALYWSWLRIISKETGDSTKGLHAHFGDEFLPKTVVMAMGKQKEVIKSTTELGVKEFTQYLQQIEAAMAEFGIHLPHPGDMEW